eukprot:3328008-Rhodomonas_salina.1
MSGTDLAPGGGFSQPAERAPDRAGGWPTPSRRVRAVYASTRCVVLSARMRLRLCYTACGWPAPPRRLSTELPYAATRCAVLSLASGGTTGCCAYAATRLLRSPNEKVQRQAVGALANLS